MTRPKLSVQPAIPPWFWLGSLGIWGVALGLRFWGLERFNTLVFDEIYFAKFGHNYLTHTSFFDAHPPLGKYLIALGIWLKGFNPWGYRWMNALVGSCIPLMVVGVGYQLTRRYSFALLAGALAMLDGLLLVESRYGLINVYLLSFGLLGQWFVLVSSRRQQGWKHWLWLSLAGLSFGAAAATKWNSLGFLLGLYLCWGALRLGRWGQNKVIAEKPLDRFSRLSLFKLFIFIPCVGAVLYGLAWIPHLLQNPEFDFVQVHQQMFSYHESVGNGPKVHPYCSTWVSWPLMLRPVSYFYQRNASLMEPVPLIGPPPPASRAKIVYSVYATGNPLLWWGTTIAIILVLALCLWQVWTWVERRRQGTGSTMSLYIQDQSMLTYIATSYVANLLPWLSISRCAFLYHYMPAYLFASLALAWLIETWFRSPLLSLKVLASTIVLLSVAGFLFWLPFYLGLPLSPEAWQLRIWLKSWV
jgi:dolichyl-phosphate-mannose-protein mannosyltransferase